MGRDASAAFFEIRFNLRGRPRCATLFSMTQRKSSNANLHKAKDAKQDEFYTQISDIEQELRHYTRHFAGKVVYCNCDDPRVSNFYRYFAFRFHQLGLKKLITTGYKNQNPDLFSRNDSERSFLLEYQGELQKGELPIPEKIGTTLLKGDGDFRSAECVELLKQADIVVTNPPFSLFREFLTQLVEHDKKFVIIGNKNAITYKEIFKLIKENKMWVGQTPMGADMMFDVPGDLSQEMLAEKKEGSGYKIVDGVVKGRAQAAWFTNLDIRKRHENIILCKNYNPLEYPKYDNYDAIEVSKVADIPMDWEGAMGVPITFLDKYNPEEFELLGWTRGLDEFDMRQKKPQSNLYRNCFAA